MANGKGKAGYKGEKGTIAMLVMILASTPVLVQIQEFFGAVMATGACLLGAAIAIGCVLLPVIIPLVWMFQPLRNWGGSYSSHGGTILANQRDGNMVLIAPGNVPIWATGTNGTLNSILTLQDDGNVVVYAQGNVPVWANGR